MKKLIGSIVLISVVFLSYAQQSEVRSLNSFKGVRAGEAIDVYLKKGDKESVRLVVTGAELSDVLTEVSGSNLRIYMKSGSYRNRTVKAYVTYVTLEKISASSAGNFFSDGEIKTKIMDISASSAASVELKLVAESVSIDVSSAGDVVLEGRSKELEVDVSSGGEVDAYSFESEQVEVSVSSGGSAKVNATAKLNASASSGGTVRFRGNPGRTNSNASSGGSIKKAN